MPSLHEIAFLIAFISPVIVLAAINVALALEGEIDTLLIPRPMRFESIVIAEEPIAEESFDYLEPLRAAA